MRFRVRDLIFAPLLAVALTAAGLVIVERPALRSDSSPGKTRGWKAGGYLVPYPVIPAIQPIRRWRGRAQPRQTA